MLKLNLDSKAFSVKLIDENDIKTLCPTISNVFSTGNPAIASLKISPEDWYPVAYDHVATSIAEGYGLMVLNDRSEVCAFHLAYDFSAKMGDHELMTHCPKDMVISQSLLKLMEIERAFFDPLVTAAINYLHQKNIHPDQPLQIIHGTKGGSVKPYGQYSFLLLLSHMIYLIGEKLGYKGFFGIATHQKTSNYAQALRHLRPDDDFFYLCERRFADFPQYSGMDPDLFARMYITNMKSTFQTDFVAKVFHITPQFLEDHVDMMCKIIEDRRRKKPSRL